MNVISPSGATVVWTRHWPSPTDSRTKLPSSAEPLRPTVSRWACSSASCSQVEIARGSPPATANLALAGSAAASSAGVLPGNRGNPAGTESQIRPQSVSDWPAARDPDGDPPGLTSIGASGSIVALGAAVGAPADPVIEGVAVPQPIRNATGSVSRRR